MSKIKDHFEKHKTSYIVGGVCLTVGAIAGVCIRQVVVNDSLNVSINSPKTNVVITELARRGHPGRKLRCNETGEAFASIRRASDVLGVSRFEIYNVLKGDADSAGGFTFTDLGEAS